jgi:hypothetical protein
VAGDHVPGVQGLDLVDRPQPRLQAAAAGRATIGVSGICPGNSAANSGLGRPSGLARRICAMTPSVAYTVAPGTGAATPPCRTSDRGGHA